MPFAHVDSASQAGIGYYYASQPSKEEVAAYNKAQTTYERCVSLLLDRNDPLSDNDRGFLKNLADYMRVRFKVTDGRYKGPSLFGKIGYLAKCTLSSDNCSQVSARAEFIAELLTCIESGDKQAELDYLNRNESMIELFKGKRSQKLFDILSERRGTLASYSRAFIPGIAG